MTETPTHISSGALPLAVKIGYGTGDFAINTAMTVVSLYLLYYFTDVFQIGATAAAWILLLARGGLAFGDPVIGRLCDRTRSRWGSKRPYLLFGAAPLGISLYLLFFSPVLNELVRVAYAFGMFLVFAVSLSVVMIPYGSLTASLTGNADERSSLSGYRMVFAFLGTILAAGLTRPAVAWFSTEAEGFRAVGGFYGILMIGAIWITFFSVREKAVEASRQTESFRQTVAYSLQNRPFLLLALSTSLFQVAMNLLAAIVNYYFIYNLRAEKWIPVAFLAMFVTGTLCIPFFVFLSRRKSKRFALNTGMGTYSVVLIAIYFLGERHIAFTIILLVLGGFGLSALFLCPWAMIPDTVEYAQWRFGVREEATLYGFFFFCYKLAGSAAGFLAGIGLKISGYVPKAAQTAAALEGIRFMMSILPAAFILAGIAVLHQYPIDQQMHRRMIRDIQDNIEGNRR